MFQLVDRPLIAPAQTLTGSTVGPVVDTERILPQHGRVYLSRIEVAECVRLFPDVAEALAGERGWVSQDDAEAMRAEITALKAELAEALEGRPRVMTVADVEDLLDRAVSVGAAVRTAVLDPPPARQRTRRAA